MSKQEITEQENTFEFNKAIGVCRRGTCSRKLSGVDFILTLPTNLLILDRKKSLKIS